MNSRITRPIHFGLNALIAFLAALTPLSAHAQDISLMSIAAQAGVVGTLAALLVALLVAPPGTKRLWVGVVVLIALGSAGITYSMMVISVGRLDPRVLMPYFFGFWALSFCVLVATRIRYWLRLDRMAEQ
jgi:hypothetical protein